MMRSACLLKNIPELTGYSVAEIVNHQQTPLPNYIVPIIDFKAETKIMKDALYTKKKSPDGRMHVTRVYKKHGSRLKTRRA